MAPYDLARFVLAFIVIAVLPGYTLATLARPRALFTERIALAVPCAYGLVAICGLTTILLRIPFNLLSYAAFALPVAVVGMHRLWRCRTEQSPTLSGWWWLAPVGVALVQAVAIALVYAGDTLPSGSDPVAHTVWTSLIARSQTFPIAMISSQAGVNGGGFYPPVFHALTALVLDVTPMPVYQAVFFSVMVSISLLPFALFSYVRAITGSTRLGGLAALTTLAFEPLPFFMLAQGQYTLEVALLFPPLLALVLRDSLAHGDRRATALAVLLGIGLFYTHHTELVTTALLTCAITFGLLRSARSWIRAFAYGGLIIMAWASAAIPAIQAARRTMVGGALVEIQERHDFTQSSQVQMGSTLHGYVQWVYGHNLGYLLLASVIIGAIWCLARRQYLGLVLAQAILFAIFIDATSYNVLQRVYVLTFPWALWERLAATHYWFAPPLATIGVDITIRFFQRSRHAASAAFAILATSPLLALGVALPLAIAIGRAATLSFAREAATSQDVATLIWLAQHAHKNAVVVNDGDMKYVATYDAPTDAGLWIPAFGGPQPLIGRGGAGPGNLGDRLYLLRHIADSPLPARATRYVQQHHVQYVFYGATVRPGETRHLSLTRLLSDPHLELSYSSITTCREGITNTYGSCPTTASYVFTIRPIE